MCCDSGNAQGFQRQDGFNSFEFCHSCDEYFANFIFTLYELNIDNFWSRPRIKGWFYNNLIIQFNLT